MARRICAARARRGRRGVGFREPFLFRFLFLGVLLIEASLNDGIAISTQGLGG